jgi:VWFA-related protein
VTRWSSVGLAGVLLALCAGQHVVLIRPLVAQSLEAPQTPPVFRSEARLVPVDIRVVDANNRPVTNLTLSDFTVLEDGVPQAIQHFSTHCFTPDSTPPPALAGINAALPGFTGEALAPSNRRVFLIAFGRGEVQSVAKGIDGVADFVRRRVMPQDLVGVIAWNRALEFTTDRQMIGALVGRFEGGYMDVSSQLRLRDDLICSLAREHTMDPTLFARSISPPIQQSIDAVFGGAGEAGIRTILPDGHANAAHMAAEARRWVGAVEAAGAAEDNTLDNANLPDECASDLQSLDDLGTLYAAIDYLRHLDGEKHLVFVSEVGLKLEEQEDDLELAAAAANARVAIDYIHTGGAGEPRDLGVRARVRVQGVDRPALAPREGMARQSLFATQTATTLATLTGGTSYWNRLKSASDDLATLDEVTRFQYVLGYYTSGPLDSRLRRIEVRLNRPGLTVMYRRSYYATPPRAFDRERLLRESRMAAVAAAPEPVLDIPIRATASYSTSSLSVREVKTEAGVDTRAITFTRANGRATASVAASVWYLGDDDELIRQLSWNIDLSFSDDELSNFPGGWMPMSLATPVGKPVRRVKIVLYQSSTDRVGSAIAEVP